VDHATLRPTEREGAAEEDAARLIVTSYKGVAPDKGVAPALLACLRKL
jgi:hypothetical protein